MMRVKPHKEEPNVDIILRSGIATRDDKGKKPEEGGWVRKTPFCCEGCFTLVFWRDIDLMVSKEPISK